MTRDDIERITRKAGGFDATPEFLARFANLVAQHEREACAKVIERDCIDDMTRREEAAAIRARGNA
jgi:hypothetical protein